MIQYILLITIGLAALLLFYDQVLRAERKFSLNRFYLLFGLLIVLAAPKIGLPSFSDGVINHQYVLPEFVVSAAAEIDPLHINKPESKIEISLVAVIWFLGFLISSFWTLFNLGKVALLFIGKPKKYRGVPVYRKANYSEPFSFLGSVFLPTDLEEDEEQIALAHELIHVNHFHTFDRIILLLIRSVFWFHPLVWLVEKRIIENHEFTADFLALKEIDRNRYVHTVLKFSGLPILDSPAVANSFSKSSLLNRIVMMNKTNKTNWMKYAFVLPLLVLIVLFSCENEIILPSTDFSPHASEAPDSGVNEVFKVVEQMPMFPGCDDISDADKKKNCSDRNLLEYIYKRILYPEEARENGIEGTAVVSFVIEKDGSVSNITVLRDPGGGTGDSAKAVVESMNEEDIRWSPGLQKGKRVRVQYNIPVKFKLEQNTSLGMIKILDR